MRGHQMTQTLVLALLFWQVRLAFSSPLFWTRTIGDATLAVTVASQPFEWSYSLSGSSAAGRQEGGGRGGGAKETDSPPLLIGALPAVHCHGQWYEAPVSSSAGTANMGRMSVLQVQAQNDTHISDLERVGVCDALHVFWSASNSSPQAPSEAALWVTSFYACTDGGSFVFGQTFPSGCTASNTTQQVANGTTQRPPDHFDAPLTSLSEFPSFRADIGGKVLLTSADVSYVSWSGTFAWQEAFGGAVGLQSYTGGSLGGPLLLLPTNVVSPTVVLSPLDHFSTGVFGRRSGCAHNQSSTTGSANVGPAAASTCPTTLQDMDFDGGDLYALQNVSSLDACCAACRWEQLCACLTYNAARATCYLKSTAAGRVPRKGSVAASLCAVDQYEAEVLAFGVKSDITSIPQGFALHSIVSVASPQNSRGGKRKKETQKYRRASSARRGANQAMMDWGTTMQEAHGTTRLSVDRDLVSTHLGVWTDNGAYYYGGRASAVPNASMLASWFHSFRQQDIPVRYLQMDPYWYHGVTWDADPKLYPDGLAGVSKDIGLPLLLYSNMWRPASQAAYQDAFNFTDSLKYYHYGRAVVYSQVMPQSSRAFYQHIITPYAPFMAGFEVDFSNYEASLYPGLNVQVDQVEGWMDGFAHAAAQIGVPTQLCMAVPSELMLALKFPAITNARASTDNFPVSFINHGHVYNHQDRFKIGYTSLLLWPLALRPFLDVIWTTAEQPGNPYGVKRHNIELQVIVAILSAGPLGIGDGPGYTNRSLVELVCDPQGRLMQPSVPATPIDAMYLPSGHRNRPQFGDIFQTHTYSAPAGLITSHIVLSVSVNKTFALVPQMLWPAPLDDVPLLAVSLAQACLNGSAVSSCAQEVSSTSPLSLRTPSPQGLNLYLELYTLVPLLHGYALLGDRSKYVRLSPQRFPSVDISTEGIKASLRGAPHEQVPVQYVVPDVAHPLGRVQEVVIELDANGEGQLLVKV